MQCVRTCASKPGTTPSRWDHWAGLKVLLARKDWWIILHNVTRKQKENKNVHTDFREVWLSWLWDQWCLWWCIFCNSAKSAACENKYLFSFILGAEVRYHLGLEAVTNKMCSELKTLTLQVEKLITESTSLPTNRILKKGLILDTVPASWVDAQHKHQN